MSLPSMVAITLNVAEQSRLFISEQPTESIQRTRSTFTSASGCLLQHLTHFSPSGTRFESIAFGANERTPKPLLRTVYLKSVFVDGESTLTFMANRLTLAVSRASIVTGVSRSISDDLIG